ncbi:hypothetical protein AB6N23_08005 [Cellulomonas sp. 179-A 9B4 NHS]|uniref:hypothetical protein n=1 Tax=Cellulomonas sp. 179-A 9B4 NHS TaxID=3142379 RepID=UPI0039A06E9F
MDLAEACYHLRERREMYVLDDRYASVVAFVTGLASASDGRVLEGFQELVQERLLDGRTTPRHWWAVVRDSVADGGADGDAEATTRLLDLLEEFAHGPTGTVVDGEA